MIVTAFGPFGRFSSNPSEVLGRVIFGDRLVVLPVSYRAVDRFLDTVGVDTVMLMLGVAGCAAEMRIEHVARYANGGTADIEGECRPREGDHFLQGRLWEGVDLRSDCWRESRDAGDYLCNYIYYESSRRFPNMKAGFVHIPPFSAVPIQLQACRLRRLLHKISIA